MRFKASRPTVLNKIVAHCADFGGAYRGTNGFTKSVIAHQADLDGEPLRLFPEAYFTNIISGGVLGLYARKTSFADALLALEYYWRKMTQDRSALELGDFNRLFMSDLWKTPFVRDGGGGYFKSAGSAANAFHDTCVSVCLWNGFWGGEAVRDTWHRLAPQPRKYIRKDRRPDGSEWEDPFDPDAVELVE